MAKFSFKSMILFENDNYIVINKPPFIASLDDRNDAVNVLALAKGYYKEAQLGHRLDKETSGALVVAKNPEAYKSLSIQFEKRLVKKEYHTVVEGIHDFDDLKIDAPIYTLGKGTVRIHRNRGKASQTNVTTMQAYKAHTLLACFPLSGRMHQIRIHLNHLNIPIMGDETYGGKPFYLSSIKRHYHLKKDTEELPLIKRMALHSFMITFKDLHDEIINVEAPYPKDFAVLLKQLDKNR